MADDADQDWAWEGAVGVTEKALKRVREIRQMQAEQRLILIEELRICELMLQEATNAENALESLVAGDIYRGNEAILERWYAYEETVTHEPHPEPDPLAISRVVAMHNKERAILRRAQAIAGAWPEPEPGTHLPVIAKRARGRPKGIRGAAGGKNALIAYKVARGIPVH